MRTPQPSSATTPEATFGVEAARRRLPELLERVAAGERIVIQRHRTPMAALVPLTGQAPTDPRLRQQQVQSLSSEVQSLRQLRSRPSSFFPVEPDLEPTPTPPSRPPALPRLPGSR